MDDDSLREQNAALTAENEALRAEIVGLSINVGTLQAELDAALADVELLERALSEPKFRKRGRRGEDDA